MNYVIPAGVPGIVKVGGVAQWYNKINMNKNVVLHLPSLLSYCGVLKILEVRTHLWDMLDQVVPKKLRNLTG